MSKPYVVQEDSPNLVIVPTITCYEPPSKKPKLGSGVPVQELPTPTKNCDNNVFAKKTVSKLNFGAPITNNDKLIDVRKNSPPSWASNFLQSIGGSSAKFARQFSTAPKMSSLRKGNTEPGSNKDINLPNTTKNTKTNTASIHPMMDEKSSLLKKPPININLIRPLNIQKPAHQPPKEFNQPNCISKPNESKKGTSTNRAKVNNWPSLPKNYKIPIHSKCNKPTGQPVTENEVSEISNVTKSYQTKSDIIKLQSVIHLPKTNHATIQPKHNKLVHPGNIMNKEIIYTLPKSSINNTHTNQDKAKLEKQKTTDELNYDKEVDLFLSKVTKVKECKAQPKNYKNTDKPKCGMKIIQQPKINKEQMNKDTETKEPEQDKEIKKRKTIKESGLPKSYRDPIPEKCNEEVTRRKTDDEVARSKIKNKKETTCSTKLKTKIVNIHCKSKHSEVTRPKKPHGQSKIDKENSNVQGKPNKTTKISPKKPPQSSSIKVDSEKKKKGAIENNTGEAESTASENKQHTGIKTNITKKEMSQSINDERSSKSISPIKSVVRRIKSDLKYTPDRFHKEVDHHAHFEKTSYKELDYNNHTSETAFHKDPNIDLRTKLKRKINKKYIYKKYYNCGQRSTKDKFATVANTEPFVPKENLIISFDAKDGNEEKVMVKTSPVKKLARKQPPGGKKCKKIKLEINIVIDNGDTTEEESVKTEDEANEESIENTDFSFLDDFNVDEIVQSLNECKSSSISLNDEANMAVHDGKIHDSSKTADTEAMAKCQNIKLMTQNHHTMELQRTSHENRSLNNEMIESKHGPDAVINSDTAADIQTLPTLDNLTIKKEIDMNQNVDVERTIKLMQNEKDIKACTASSESAMIKSELVSLSDQEADKNIFQDNVPMDISQDNIGDEMHVMDSDVPMLDDKKSITSSENAKKYANDHSKTIIEHDSKAINIAETNLTEQIEVLKTETSNDGAERDVIIIDDSESENEIEIKKYQTPKKNEEAKKATTIISDEVLVDPYITMAVNSASTLNLDTDYDIEEKSNDKCQLVRTDQNTNSRNLNLTECESNTKEIKTKSANLVREEQTADNNSVELKNKAFTESNSEGENTPIAINSNSDELKSNCKNTSSEGKLESNDEAKPGVDKQQGKNENEGAPKLANIAEKVDSKTSEDIPNEKSTETVASKKNTVNAQIKNNIRANCENADEVETKTDTKPKAEPSSNKNVYSDKFVRKLGCRLQDITGQRYTITQLIHVGRFSKIYRCQDLRKSDFTVKATKSSYDGIPLGVQKQNMLMKLQNGVPEQNLNCVRHLEGFSVFGQWCYLMEYYPRNLKEALTENEGSFHIDLVQVLSRQLVSAVTILRNNNIIHTDIKPSHILINASKTRVKLCGFDQAFYFDGRELLPNTGTCNYRAPELILGYQAGYGIDVWSTALVMYEMATNRKLFPGIFNNDILYKQLCTLGSIPMEMLLSSKYKNTHFIGTSFARIVNSQGQRIVVNEITGSDRINNILFQTYATEWGKNRHTSVKSENKAKLCAFSKLLYSMLAMHPRHRIAIEFVFANPFIYEIFDS